MPELRGKIYLKKDTEIVTETFRKRLMVLETIEQYPQKIPMQLVNDRVTILDNFNVGQDVTVNFNYRGTEHTKEGKETAYFLNLDVWKIN